MNVDCVGWSNSPLNRGCPAGTSMYPVAIPISTQGIHGGMDSWYGSAWFSGNCLQAAFNTEAQSDYSDNGGELNIVVYCLPASASSPTHNGGNPWVPGWGQES